MLKLSRPAAPPCVNRLGLPVPAAPFLIAAGALAGLDESNLISDFAWFQLGKRKGGFLLQWFDRKSPEHQSYGAKLQSAYLHYGPPSILVSKFIPLFNIVAPQAAVTFRLAGPKFFALDASRSVGIGRSIAP
jgi:membrane protein DedA with SNARE-associated domain